MADIVKKFIRNLPTKTDATGNSFVAVDDSNGTGKMTLNNAVGLVTVEYAILLVNGDSTFETIENTTGESITIEKLDEGVYTYTAPNCELISVTPIVEDVNQLRFYSHVRSGGEIVFFDTGFEKRNTVFTVYFIRVL